MTPLWRDNQCHNRTVSVDEAGAALESGEWHRALELVAELDDDAALQVRAAASYGAGDVEGAIGAWEAIHANRSALGDASGAAWAACMVALHLLIDTGLMSPVRAWVRRADGLVADLAEDPAQAVIAMVSTYERFMSGDAAESRRQANRAVELGRRLGVTAAVVIGHTALGRLLVIEGQVEDGLALLDDVAGELMIGDVDPLTTGMMYCELICAAQSLGRHDLARDWTDLMDRWRHGAAFGGIHGRCRVHRAELLRMSGPAETAEQEALEACVELRPWLRRELGWPLVELGNIRRIRGDLEGAERAYLEAHQLVWSPQPGLALLRLDQGHAAVAAALIADAVERPESNPSKEQPPFGDLRLAPLLAAQVEIAETRGDTDTARVATSALSAIAETFTSPVLAAEADIARARLALLEGHADDAIAASTRALEAWSQLAAPFGMGVARVLRGRAHRLAGNHSSGRLDLDGARHDFEGFGAIGALASVDRLLHDAPDEDPVPPETVSTDPDTVVFSQVGNCRRIVWHGTETLITDLKGFRYLGQLVGRCDQEMHVLDLVSTGHEPAAVSPGDGNGLRTGFQPGLPLLDNAARDAYRRRLRDVDEDIADAEAAHDLGRLEQAEHDREHLVAELSRAFGLGERLRRVGGDVERARSSVTRSLRYALRRLSEAHPDLGAHLDRHIETGTYCSYRPDPLHPLTWDLG